MNTETIVNEIKKALEDIKGQDIVAIDMNGKSDVADVMMICTGTSVRHTSAIAEKVAKALKNAGIHIYGIEGKSKGDWVLLDVGSVILHIMISSSRELYQLEKLYQL